MTSSDLAEFLHAAKSATYAAQGGAAFVTPLLQDSKQLEYRSGDYFYRDLYVGMFRFVGQEIVYHSERAVWSMSYAGGLVDGAPHDSAKAVYGALRHALRSAEPQLPVRGPTRHETDGFIYTCEIEGSLEWFKGVESVSQQSRLLYSLQFFGGLLA